jgi:hypothetical protein
MRQGDDRRRENGGCACICMVANAQCAALRRSHPLPLSCYCTYPAFFVSTTYPTVTKSLCCMTLVSCFREVTGDVDKSRGQSSSKKLVKNDDGSPLFVLVPLRLAFQVASCIMRTSHRSPSRLRPCFIFAPLAHNPEGFSSSTAEHSSHHLIDNIGHFSSS